MDGRLAQAATLVSFGNAALHTRAATLGNDWRQHSTFTATRQVRFEYALSFWDALKPQLVAQTPEEWFLWLRHHKTVMLQLVLTQERLWLVRTKVSTRFVVWRAVYGHGRPCLDPRNVTYRARAVDAFVRREFSLRDAIANLRDAVCEAVDFCRATAVKGPISRLKDARRTLDGERPAEVPYYPDMLYDASVQAARLASASVKAWVFGGDGVWGEGTPATVTGSDGFRRVSSALHIAVLDGIAAAANERTNAALAARQLRA